MKRDSSILFSTNRLYLDYSVPSGVLHFKKTMGRLSRKEQQQIIKGLENMTYNENLAEL